MRLLCTVGDCNGIGLEVWAKALQALEGHSAVQGVMLTLLAHPQTVAEYFRLLKLPVRVTETALELGTHHIELLPCPTYAPIRWGTPDAAAARQAWEALDHARRLLSEGRADAVVTLPVTKHTLYQLGWDFPGQTEFFAHSSEQPPLMLFVAGTLRIALATTHLPLRRVPEALTPTVLHQTYLRLHRSLQHDFGICAPRIALLGLNPHAGEEGMLGSEELQLRAVLEQLQAAGYRADGFFAADAFFARRRWREYDAVLAAYHDQGLIPFKLLAPTTGVNVTLGLPFVRTSPAHGSAYDIAGQGRADPESMRRALLLALRLTRRRRLHHRSSVHSKG